MAFVAVMSAALIAALIVIMRPVIAVFAFATTVCGGFDLRGPFDDFVELASVQPDPAALRAVIDFDALAAHLEALAAAGVGGEDAAIADARTFVARCQAVPGDGGFCGAPGGGLLGGKGGRDETGRARSYGTATADGVRALLACGHATSSSRVQAALSWLAQCSTDAVPGLLPEFEASLRFYWAAALARMERTLGHSVSGPSTLRAFVLSRQREDGSFIGLAGAMKEDDPIVATVLALQLFSVR